MGMNFQKWKFPTLFGCALRFSARSIDFTLGGKFTRWFLQQHYKGANRVHSALQIWFSLYKCKFWDQKSVAIYAFALYEVTAIQNNKEKKSHYQSLQFWSDLKAPLVYCKLLNQFLQLFFCNVFSVLLFSFSFCFLDSKKLLLL